MMIKLNMRISPRKGGYVALGSIREVANSGGFLSLASAVIAEEFPEYVRIM